MCNIINEVHWNRLCQYLFFVNHNKFHSMKYKKVFVLKLYRKITSSQNIKLYPLWILVAPSVSLKIGFLINILLQADNDQCSFWIQQHLINKGSEWAVNGLGKEPTIVVYVLSNDAFKILSSIPSDPSLNCIFCHSQNKILSKYCKFSIWP